MSLPMHHVIYARCDSLRHPLLHLLIEWLGRTGPRANHFGRIANDIGDRELGDVFRVCCRQRQLLGGACLGDGGAE